MLQTLPRIGSLVATCCAGALLCAQFSDDFSDLDFTSGVVWSGNTTLFTASTGALQSQSPGAANYQLSTPSTQAADGQWEFYVNLKFSTSGANYADVYLMSSAADLASGVNGYFVRIGGTSDRVELFRSDAGTPVSLGVQSPDGVVNSSTDNPLKLRVQRSAADLWTLEFDDGAVGSYALAGTITDGTYSASTHFGVRIEQSTAVGPINNHFFDDFGVGPIPVDTDPPTILNVEVLSDMLIDVVFSEAVEQGSAETEGNYDIQPFNSAALAVRDGVDLARVHLTLTSPLLNGNTYTVFANGVLDLSGNAASDQYDFTYVVPAVPGPRSVVINEIMADPSPVVGLPDAEFIELHNPSATDGFDLAGWTFTDGSSTATLPAIVLGPGQILIVTSTTSAALFSGFGAVVGVSSFPSLNNDGDPLVLKDNGGATIDAVTYALDWYQDAVKDDGGWTLEQIDPTTPCSSASNWIASIAPQGGTPGAQNSVYAIVSDIDPPALLSVLVNSATEIDLVFDEAMDQASTLSGVYSIAPVVPVSSVINLTTTSVRLTLATPLVIGQLYTITVTQVSDCPGNVIASQNSATFALPEPAMVGDVVINEVLYDPRVGGYDFVELYNRSQKVLSLAGWKMANESGGVIGSPMVITSASVLLLPGKYVALTESPSNIATEYPLSHTDRLFFTDLPSYNNGEGTVVLQAPDGTTLDLFRYGDDLHFTLLDV